MGLKQDPKAWKAITLDWVDLQTYDHTEIIGVCLTQRQIAILKALLITAYWSTRWAQLGVTSDQLEEFVGAIDNQLDGNDCGVCNMEFRDNPSDDCEVQYSNDAGLTWTTMFRKDICAPQKIITSETITQTTTNINTVITNNATYAGDILNVAPEWEYVDQWSDNALCYVINKYVRFVCDFAVNEIVTYNTQKRSENDWLDDIAVLLAELVMDVLVATSVASGGNPITMPIVAMGALTWASVQIVEWAWDYWAGIDPDKFKDEDAIEVVACWMYNKMRGSTPTFSRWRDSLDDFVPDGVAESSISSSVAAFNAEVDIFINYMILMEEVNDIAEYLDVCDCPQPLTIDQLAGPTLSEMYGNQYTSGTTVSIGNDGGPFAVIGAFWIPETEMYYDEASPLGGVGVNLQVVLPINRLVTQVSVYWGGTRYVMGSAGDKNACVWVGNPNTDGVQIIAHSWGTGSAPQSITNNVSDVELQVTTPRQYLYVHNSMDRALGDAWVGWIHIETIPYVP